MTRAILGAAVTVALAATAAAQAPSTQKPAGRTAAKPAAPRRVTESPDITCPNVLGVGVASQLQFCDVLTGRNPADGVIIRLPPHKGVLTLTFDLHNRQTYSEEAVKAGRAYASYTATIGALTMDGTLLSRAVVRSEFRTAKDLLDRIGGGAGPKGLKAVAPLGRELISVDVPENVDAVSLLGEKLTVVSRNGTEVFTAPQRPIAAVSNIVIDYQTAPKPPARPTAKPPVKKK